MSLGDWEGDWEDGLFASSEDDPRQAIEEMRREDERRRSHAMAAGHQPVQEQESVDALLGTVLGRACSGGWVDGTFGRGGHSRSILARLSAEARLFAFDVDPKAVLEARKLESEDQRFKIFHRPFAEMNVALEGEAVQGVLLDVGVSNNQVDDAEHGFRITFDAPLDLRLNPGHGQPAAEWLQTVSTEELAWVLHQYGEDDPLIADRLAERILQHQKRNGPYKSSGHFAKVVKDIKRLSYPISANIGKYATQANPAKRTLNAIRVFLNRELQQLKGGLGAAMEILEMGGRCVIITFNPAERRVVQKFLREHEDPPASDLASLAPVRLSELYPLTATDLNFAVRRVTQPRPPRGAEYVLQPRSRSSVLFVLTKVKRQSAKVTVPAANVRRVEERLRRPPSPSFRGGSEP